MASWRCVRGVARTRGSKPLGAAIRSSCDGRSFRRIPQRRQHSRGRRALRRPVGPIARSHWPSSIAGEESCSVHATSGVPILTTQHWVRSGSCWLKRRVGVELRPERSGCSSTGASASWRWSGSRVSYIQATRAQQECSSASGFGVRVCCGPTARERRDEKTESSSRSSPTNCCCQRELPDAKTPYRMARSSDRGIRQSEGNETRRVLVRREHPPLAPPLVAFAKP
jgi:hypothetical protein